MRFFTALLAAPLAALAAPVLDNHAQNALPIAGQFIAVMKKEATNQDSVLSQITQHLGGASPRHTYDLDGFRGFAVNAADDVVSLISNMAEIDYIQPDYRISKAEIEMQRDAPWGLARISSRHLGGSEYVYDSSAGEGTHAYVIDTGIFVDHPQFEGRASWGASFVDGEKADDLNGHGTHVAGTIGSKTYGVAKKTNLIAVKVLDADGSGATSDIIAGMQWAAKDAKTKGSHKCVANMSLGGLRVGSQAINDAAASLINQGLFLAVAAGNSYLPAGLYSPASEPSVCTVGATDNTDTKADFSNFGLLVDIFAPGVDIISTYNNGSTAILSGTSMATPHITGLGAYLLGLEGPRAPEALCSRIQALSNKDAVHFALSPNADLAFNGGQESQASQN